MKRFLSLLLAVTCILTLASCGSGGSSGKQVPDRAKTVFSFFADESTVYVLCDSGSGLKIPNASDALVSPDRKRLVYVTDDGDLYCVDFKNEKTDLSAATLVADDVASIIIVKDAGFCFRGNDQSLNRVMFSDLEVDDIAASYETANLTDNADLFYSGNGKVYFLPHDADDAESIGSYKGKLKFILISRAGNSACWLDYDNSVDTAYYFDGNDTVKIHEFTSQDYSTTTLQYTNFNQDYTVVYSYKDSVVYVKAPNSDFTRVNIGKNPYFGVFTDVGEIGIDTRKEISGFYVKAGDYGDYSVYWFSPDGEKEKIVSGVLAFTVADGTLYYITKDKDLYRTKAEGAKTAEGEKLAGDVYALTSSGESGYVFYVRNAEEVKGSFMSGTGTLYCFRAGDKEPTKIAGDVVIRYYGILNSYNTELTLADHGKSVLYFRDPEEHSYDMFGTMYLYKIGNSKPKRIAQEVFTYSISGMKNNLYSDAFFFARYIDDAYTDDDIYDYYFFNGKETVSIAKEVVH